MEQSILSAGIVIYSALREELADKVTKVFPVVTSEACLPYVCYNRERLDTLPHKASSSADTAVISISVFAATYSESVELAEAVRSALDFKALSSNGLTIRYCQLVDAKETWTDDAYVQTLDFSVKV